MFKYKTEVKVATNPDMNLGLFAKEFIPKDAIVWEFIEGIDIKISVDRIEQLPEVQKEYFYKYAWIEGDYYFCSCDHTNFINHSYQSNLKIVDEVVIAVRDIQAGEELFENYGEFDSEFDEYKDELF
jgi:SET domain-containing protein